MPLQMGVDSMMIYPMPNRKKAGNSAAKFLPARYLIHPPIMFRVAAKMIVNAKYCCIGLMRKAARRQ